MSDLTPADVELLQRLDHTRPNEEDFAVLEAMAARASETEDDDLGYAVRMRLTSWGNMLGDTESMITTFGWCVGAHDRDPVRFPQIVGHHDLLFQYKWMAGRLAANPAYPLAEVSAIHEDMSFRYRAAGATQSGVLQSRMGVALQIGDVAAATRFHDEREAVDTDDYSHCEACVRSEDAAYYERIGDTDRALALYAEITNEGLSCGEEPEAAQAQSLLLLLRTGHLDEARRAHIASYRVARSGPGNMHILLDHVVFCVVTGNLSRALTIADQVLREYELDPLNLSLVFGASRDLAVLLDAVVAAGAGDSPLRGSENPGFADIFGARTEPGTAAELLPLAWARAEELAAAFDARNGTAEYARRVAGSRLLTQERWDLTLEQAAFVPSVAATETEPTDAAGWLDHARGLHTRLGFEAPLAAAQAGLAAAGPDDDPDTVIHLHIAAIQSLIELDRPEEAAAHLATEISLLRAKGEHVQADIEERYGLALFGADVDIDTLIAAVETGRAEAWPTTTLADVILSLADHLFSADGREAEALPYAREGRALADRVSDAPLYWAATLITGYAAMQIGEFEEAVECFDDLIDSDAASEKRAYALHARAHLAGQSEDFALGARLCDDHIALCQAAGDRAGAIEAAMLGAELLSRMDQDAAAASRISFALDQAVRSESPLLPKLEFQLGQYLNWSGSWELAIEHLDNAYRLSSESAEAGPDDLGDILFWLAQAAQNASEIQLAYGALTRSVELTQAEFPAIAARNGTVLGNILIGAEHEDAVAVLEAAFDAAGRSENPVALANAQHALGRARAQAGDPGGLDDLAAVSDHAREQGADWLIADVTDSRARALDQLGRHDEAVATALTAADAYADCGDDNGAAMAEVFAARSLAGRERGDEAVAIYHAAIERVTPGTPPYVGIGLELGAHLESLGRHDEAARARAAAGARDSQA